MKNVTVTKLVSDKLKAQKNGAGYDGSYGAEPTGATDPAKDIPENKQATSVVEPADLPEKAATSVVEPADLPEKVAVADQEAEKTCTCENCGGTGKVAKKTEDMPDTKMEEEKPEVKEQTTGGTYDGTYGKAEDKMEETEDETPAKKAKRIQNTPLSKLSMDELFGRINANTRPGNPKTIQMHDQLNGALAANVQEMIKQFAAK